jgi:hypothetical protein
MAYEPKPNTGTFLVNDRKTAENHPDFKGDLYVDINLLKTLKPENGLVKIAVAGWNKKLGTKDAISLSASAPYVKPADNDLPY